MAPTLNTNILHQNLYDLQWYVVGKPSDFSSARPTKVTVWSKDYVVWRTGRTTYSALENACPHRGASFSDGEIQHNCVVCPYHGYEYNSTGHLTRVPGIDIVNGCNTNQTKARTFDMVEEAGWVYLNTFPYWAYNLTEGSLSNNLYSEPESVDEEFECTRMQMDYEADARILTENGLDISHIGFVHSFGNRDAPCPINENPPKQVGPNRFLTKYQYEAGQESFAKMIFGSLLLDVENEFVLPHTSISRIKFNQSDANYVNTIITFATPITANKTRLYVKNYRNFWRNRLGDELIRNMMRKTMEEDRRIVENIYENDKNGRFNMKYDKLANTFRMLYTKLYESRRL